MATIKLINDTPVMETVVSNIFIDTFMPEANGEFVKIYLYLLRTISDASRDLSISAIADCFDHTEKDVIRGLKYWERVGLLKLDFAPDKSLEGIHILNPMADSDASFMDKSAVVSTSEKSADNIPVLNSENATSYASKASVSAGSVVVPITAPTKKEYTLDEMKVFQSSPEITELIFVIESYMNRPLSSTDLNALFYWYDELHFSCELIDYLVQYCMSKGHSSSRYMDKVAISWHENGINTIEEAKENAAITNQAYYGVMKAFGIVGRSLIESEKNYINQWTKDYKFDLPLIQEACSRTITATHQPSFEYADKILSNWASSSVHTLDDVRKLDDIHANKKKTVKTPVTAVKKNKFTNFSQRDYDFDQLETMLLNKPV